MQLFTATFVKNKCKFLRFLVQQKLALLIKQTQGNKFKEFYIKEVLNSWTKPISELSNYITTLISRSFRFLVKIIHTVAGLVDDPE